MRCLGDTSSGHLEGCRSPACRDRRMECQRLHSQVSNRFSPEDRPLGAANKRLVLRDLDRSIFRSKEGTGGRLRGVTVDESKATEVRGTGTGRGRLLCPAQSSCPPSPSHTLLANQLPSQRIQVTSAPLRGYKHATGHLQNEGHIQDPSPLYR